MKKKVWIVVVVVLLMLFIFIGSNLGLWMYLKAPYVGLTTPIEISGSSYILDTENELQCLGEASYVVFGYIDGKNVNGAEGIFRGAIDVSDYSIPLTALPHKYNERTSGAAVVDRNGYLCVYYDPQFGNVPYEYEMILNPNQPESVMIQISSPEGTLVAVDAPNIDDAQRCYLDYLEAQN